MLTLDMHLALDMHLMLIMADHPEGNDDDDELNINPPTSCQ